MSAEDSASDLSSGSGSEELEEPVDDGDEYSTGPGSKAASTKRNRRDARSKGSKRQKVAKLFEEEASEDDDDDDEDEDRRHQDIALDENDEISDEAKRITERLEARLKHRDQFLQKSEEDVVAGIEERHKARTEQVYRTAREDGGLAVARNAFLPTMRDPKLFSVRCKVGEERMLCLQLLNKSRSLSKQGKDVKIFSAVAPGTRGFFYVEARTQQAVRDMIVGIRGLFSGRITLVPLNQMPDVLRARSSKHLIKVGDYVRLRRAPYKGDLARVVSILDYDDRYVLKHVPRLDTRSYGMGTEARAELKKKKIAVPQRLFDVKEVENAGGIADRRRPPWFDHALDFYDNDYFHKGYLLKPYLARNFQSKDVKPNLEELQNFRQGGLSLGESEIDQQGSLEDGEMLDRLASADTGRGIGAEQGASKQTLRRGDIVQVREGELQNMQGEIFAVHPNGTVTVNPTDKAARGVLLEFSVDDLQKVFVAGDHVKVLNGTYAGETGHVVKIVEESDRQKAIVFTDSAAKDILVFVDDLQLSAEVATARDSLKGYNLFDLVELDRKVGVIVKVGSETLDILEQNGRVATYDPGVIRRNLNSKSRTATAMDSKRNSIAVGSVVKVASQAAYDSNGVEGTIKHIHRSFIFVQSRMRQQNHGLVVVRARDVTEVGSKVRTTGGSSGAIRGAARFAQGGKSRAPMGSRGFRNEDNMIGSTVRIRSGRHKGYIGIVISAVDDMLKVEMHSKKQTLDLPRNTCVVVGDKNGQNNHGINSSADMLGMDYHPQNAFYGSDFQSGKASNPPQTPRAQDLGDSGDVWNPNADLQSHAGRGEEAAKVGVNNAVYKSFGNQKASGSAYMENTSETKISDSETKIRLLSGDFAGSTGILLTLDGNDAVVRVDGKAQVDVVQKDCLEYL